MAINKNWNLTQLLGEFIGTFLLVFISCRADIGNENSPGQNGICIMMIYMMLIYSLDHISGSHLNPAISLHHMLTGDFNVMKAIFYVCAQLAGSFVGGLVVYITYEKTTDGDIDWLGQPSIRHFLPNEKEQMPYMSAVYSEIISSAILMWLYLVVRSDIRVPNGLSGIIIGGFYGVIAIATGRFTGGSINPARQFGPALIVMEFAYFPIYVGCPLIGVIIGGFYHKMIHRDWSKKDFEINNYDMGVIDPVDIDISVEMTQNGEIQSQK